MYISNSTGFKYGTLDLPNKPALSDIRKRFGLMSSIYGFGGTVPNILHLHNNRHSSFHPDQGVLAEQLCSPPDLLFSVSCR